MHANTLVNCDSCTCVTVWCRWQGSNFTGAVLAPVCAEQEEAGTDPSVMSLPQGLPSL